MAEALLELRDISVRYGAATTLEVSALDVQAGEIVAFIGPNGAGKSTLLRVMGLLQWPSSGKVYFRRQEATPENALSLRRRMASVFQEPLLLNGSVNDNAALGLKLRGLRRDRIEKRLRPWFERLGIAHLISRQVRTLSGGEAQRTSLVRALALDPELLLLDEPFSALDPPTREALLLDLQQILTVTGITTVLVTHDLHEAQVLGKRVGVLSRGRLLQLTSNRDIFTRPATEEVAEIVGMDNRIPGNVTAAAEGMSEVRFSGGTVKVMGHFESGARVVLCIRPEDISLSRLNQDQNRSREMNQLEGRVERVSPWMAQYRIALRSGENQWVALIDKRHFAQLCLREGDDVLASFSSTAVHILRSRDH
ncbi:MAG: ABC transporter ATP-binding protein [Deltaproteobacteria bacterium]|nr:ABC transporter ATP-binding protein [Deltaproteobacteria bacterium]